MTLPSLQQLLEVENVEEYPYEKSFAEAKSDPAFVLHTSGSTGNYSFIRFSFPSLIITGIPKHLTFTNEFVSRIISASSLPPLEGYVDINQYVTTGKFFMTLPSFHVSALIS